MTTHPESAPEQTPQPRLNVPMNDAIADFLRDYMAAKNIGPAEATRMAFATLKYFDDEHEAGRRIYTVNPDGTGRREVYLMR